MSDPVRVVYEFGPFQLDASQRLLYRGGQLVPASPRTLETLLVLVARAGQLVEKEQLIRLIWPNSIVEESNLALQVSQLRKLLSDPMGLNPIATIPKRGYRFVAAVRVVGAVSPTHAAIAVTPAADVSPQAVSQLDSLALPGPAVTVRPVQRRAALTTLAAVVLVLLGILGWQLRAKPSAPIAAPSRPAAAPEQTERGPNSIVEESNLALQVAQLRKLLSDRAAG